MRRIAGVKRKANNGGAGRGGCCERKCKEEACEEPVKVGTWNECKGKVSEESVQSEGRRRRVRPRLKWVDCENRDFAGVGGERRRRMRDSSSVVGQGRFQ